MTNDARPPTVVVGIDGTPSGRDALALGRTLADLREARLVAAAVYGSDGSRAVAERRLEEAIEAGDGPVQMRTVAAASPARGLHELAEQLGAEFIVVGSTHTGPVRRVLPGSTGARLLQEAPCAVAVTPVGYAERDDRRLRVLAAGYDLSEEAEAALALATELGLAAEATLRILTVDEPHTARYGDAMSGVVLARPVEDLRDLLRATVVRKRDELPSALRADAVIMRGVPAREILAELDKGVDLLVMGSRGYGPLGRVLLGSVVAGVVEEAPCPVVIVPRAAYEAIHTDGARRGAAEPMPTVRSGA